MTDLTDATVGLLGLAIVAGVAKNILDDDRPNYKRKKKKEESFKW